VRPAQSFAVVKHALHEKTMAEITHLAYALGRVAALAVQGLADATADEPEKAPLTAEALLWRFDRVLIDSGAGETD
jgi:hypothetical protein